MHMKRDPVSMDIRKSNILSLGFQSHCHDNQMRSFRAEEMFKLLSFDRVFDAPCWPFLQSLNS